MDDVARQGESLVVTFGANAASTSLIEKWAAQEMVEVQIDRLTNLGNKLLVTLAAEAQAKEKLSNGVDRWSADVR